MRFLLSLILMFVCVHVQASSSLGESRVGGQPQMRGENYSVHFTRADGREIREYVNKNNIVFAISWVGRSHPDLSQILGRHFNDYLAVVEGHSPGRQPVLLKTSKMNIHFSGHMGHVKAYAFETQLLPPGFDLEILK